MVGKFKLDTLQKSSRSTRLGYVRNAVGDREP